MANQKISELSAITVIDDTDVLAIVDGSAVETKKISVTQVKALAPVQSVNGSTGAVSVQPTLVSGTNIKTINDESILGSGNITISGGGGSPSGVAGAIQFSDGSAFASDASNLFWDDTNNRLGIGTNVPTSALEVASDAKINGLTVGLGGGAITSNAAFGSNALINNTTGANNTAVGYQSLDANTTASFNTAVGNSSLGANTTGSENVAIGQTALGLNVSGSSNTAVGINSLRNNTASNNVAVGFEAALTNTTGENITAIGYQALRLSTGSANTAVGNIALSSNTTGVNNTAVGFSASRNNTSGFNITAFGRSALQNNLASNNTAVGFEAALSNTSGTSITAIGYRALRLSTGSNNTALGYEAGDNITTGAGNVCIGSGAEPENATDSNKFVVGSASVNAGAVTTETISADTTWTVRINGANYKIPMLAI